MTLLRAAARTMLASYFVVTGANTLRDPDAFAEEAEPVATRIVPLAQKLAPTASAYLPEDARSWARVLGAAQILGGAMLATGLGRRCGAAILATTMVPQVIAANPLNAPASERAQARQRLLRDIALTGGVLLAALDTEGKPGLAWRIGDRRQVASAAGKKATDAANKASKRAVRAGHKARHQARKASKLVQEQLR